MQGLSPVLVSCGQIPCCRSVTPHKLVQTHGGFLLDIRVVKLWAVPQGRPLQPLAILRASTPSPVQSLVVLDDLQLLCCGHLDGHLALHLASQIIAAAPAARSLNSLDMPVITVQNSCCQAHDSGLVQCSSCALGLISVGRAGSILLWSRDQLTKMAQLSCSYPPERYCYQ